MRMKKNFHESFAPGAVQRPSDRSTGLVFAAVAVIVAVVWRNQPDVLWWGIVLGSAFALTALIAPVLLRPLNILWFRFGLLLHRVVNPLVMFAVFVIVFVPAGAIMRIWHDPLRSRRRPDAASYWIERAKSNESSESMRNQF